MWDHNNTPRFGEPTFSLVTTMLVTVDTPLFGSKPPLYRPPRKVNNQINLIQKGTQDYISSCEMEARQLQEKFEAESRNVDLVEKEAHDFLENAKAALQETTVRSEEEVQMCAYKLLALIDSVSKYKEFTASKISQMKDVVSETAAAIAQVHNDSLASSIGTLPQSEV
ncbi:kinetochore protein NDC80 [Tanacetum coccineum]|uniref:Kinetochore protein NDC80 n=1 Tax=Tanacetum coccineum TaxID=301880 RepID=A0ABQ5B390_9ASTR